MWSKESMVLRSNGVFFHLKEGVEDEIIHLIQVGISYVIHVSHTHTHILKENEKDTKFFVVQRPCPCKIKTKKEVKLHVLLLKFSASPQFSCHSVCIDKMLPKQYELGIWNHYKSNKTNSSDRVRMSSFNSGLKLKAYILPRKKDRISYKKVSCILKFIVCPFKHVSTPTKQHCLTVTRVQVALQLEKANYTGEQNTYRSAIAWTRSGFKRLSTNSSYLCSFSCWNLSISILSHIQVKLELPKKPLNTPHTQTSISVSLTKVCKYFKDSSFLLHNVNQSISFNGLYERPLEANLIKHNPTPNRWT